MMTRLFPERSRPAAPPEAHDLEEATTTRALILDHAAKLFRTYGYENTSLAMIAEAIDLTATAIYRHFPSKYDLFARSVENLQLEFDARMESVGRSGTATARLREITVAHCLHQLRRSVAVTGINQMITFGQLAMHLKEPERSVVLGLQNKHLDRIKRTIQNGIDSGEFAVPDATVAAFSVISLPENLVLWFRHEGALSEDEMAKALAELVIHMVSARGGDAV